MHLWLTQDEQKEVRAAIDAFEWKHSWHLPTDKNGYTNWSSDDTLAKCLEVLEGYRTSSLQFAAKCDRLAKRLAEIQANRAKDAVGA